MTTLSGDYVKKIRIAMGLTQVQFAKKFKLQQAGVSQYEHGKSMPSGDLIMKLMAIEKKINIRYGGTYEPA